MLQILLEKRKLINLTILYKAFHDKILWHAHYDVIIAKSTPFHKEQNISHLKRVFFIFYDKSKVIAF